MPRGFGGVATGIYAVLFLCGCTPKPTPRRPEIHFTRVPQSDSAGGTKTEVVQGITSSADKQDRVVLYAETGTWWVQPLEKEPFTRLDGHMRWINGTHLGTKYAALLVSPDYRPAAHLTALPSVGGPVKAITVAAGSPNPPSPYISFGGYEWRTRNMVSRRGGSLNKYSDRNAWTDSQGALHLKITGGPKEWTCAEVTLAQSLGYGTYTLKLRDVSKFEPSVVFAFFTYDYAGGDENNREANFEVSRWGDPSVKNGQFVVQPYYVPANVFRFLVPPGNTSHSLKWEPGRMTFLSTIRTGHIFSQHVFTSGTPQPGLESPRMAFYVYNQGPYKQQHEAEVVVEKFQFLP